MAIETPIVDLGDYMQAYFYENSKVITTKDKKYHKEESINN